MKVNIQQTQRYSFPAKEVSLNEQTLGHINPTGDVLIYSLGDKVAEAKEYFCNNDDELINVINKINDYRKDNHYKYLYIDRSVMGVAQLRDDFFWSSLGFKEDENPQLLYLKD